MASPVRLYQEEMHNNLGFFAAWLPGDPIEVGDAGVLERGRFRKLASLRELGIEVQVESTTSSQGVKYTSSEGTKIAPSAGAAIAGVAKAVIKIDFSREGAFVFEVSSLQPRQITNRLEVAKAIVKAYENGLWQKEWLVVEALRTAERATIIVAEDSSAEVVLQAATEGLLASTSLVDPKLGLSVASTRGKIVHVVAASNLTPLYSCLRLRDPLFGTPSVVPVRGAAEARDLPLSRPGIQELLQS